jgi:NAD(P)H-nitrite reductase large subunit
MPAQLIVAGNGMAGQGTNAAELDLVVASILASLGHEPILDGEQAALQDTNDHFLANIQRNGTYSVVPRIPGGEITPEKLIELELRYRGIRAPHKINLGVSGCASECAEAQAKDVGVIAAEDGWNLYVGGNGGFRPRHADLLLSGIDKATLIRSIDGSSCSTSAPRTGCSGPRARPIRPSHSCRSAASRAQLS